MDFHSGVRSNLALPDILVTSARLSQVRPCTRTTFCGVSGCFSSAEQKVHFISHRERMKGRTSRPAGLKGASIMWRNFLYFGTKVPGVTKVMSFFLSI